MSALFTTELIAERETSGEPASPQMQALPQLMQIHPSKYGELISKNNEALAQLLEEARLEIVEPKTHVIDDFDDEWGLWEDYDEEDEYDEDSSEDAESDQDAAEAAVFAVAAMEIMDMS